MSADTTNEDATNISEEEEDEYSDDLFSFPDSANNNDVPDYLMEQIHDMTAWQNGKYNNCIVTFNEAKAKAWVDAKSEIEDLRKNIAAIVTYGNEQRRSVNDPVSQEECVNIYFGEDAGIFAIYKQYLKWDYSNFCWFMITSMRLCAMKCSIKHLHSMGPKVGQKQFLMSVDEYTKCWIQMDEIGAHDGHSYSATAPKPFWRLSTNAFNDISVSIGVTG